MPDASTGGDAVWSERRLVKLLVGGRGRPLGALMLAGLLALGWLPAASPIDALRMYVFDGYQRLFPRQPASSPAIIVAIDERSLAELGQWPWPRTLLADLIDAIARDDPAAIGIDMLFPERDRMSPDALADIVRGVDPQLALKLQSLPANDTIFAGAISRAPVVLGMAGLEEPDPRPGGGGTVPFLVRGGDPQPWLRHFAGSVRSLPVLDRAAAGHGLLSVDPGGGIVRTAPLLASIDGTLTPALSIEMLRVAARQPALGLSVGTHGVESLNVGDLRIPTEADGSLWIHFSHRVAARFVSASDVIAGRSPQGLFERRLVLVGATGLGLLDHQATPLDVRMPGIEIHAQLLENIFDGRLLARPSTVRQGELLLLLGCALTLIVLVPRWRPRTSALLYGGLLTVCATVGLALFARYQLLFDAAWPALATTMVFGALLGGTLADSDRQRRSLARDLQREREAAARAAGELEAARRIQLGMLPPTSGTFLHDRRFELSARLETARLVGGDLYDYFKLDQDRLFMMIGDVSGKGLPASIFMAVSKALYKSAALRSGDIGAVMRTAHREIARDNPEALFVTVFAAVLDLRSGVLQYCNAGHEPPLAKLPGEPCRERFALEGGPPLCVIDEFPYETGTHQLRPRETLCLLTDGVTEAMDAEGKLYGRARLAARFAHDADSLPVSDVLEAIAQDVRRHAAGADRSDDITLLIVRWAP